MTCVHVIMTNKKHRTLRNLADNMIHWEMCKEYENVPAKMKNYSLQSYLKQKILHNK